MIVSHRHDVDPDDYCFDTGLTFMDGFGQELLNEFLCRPESFSQRVQYNRGEHYRDLARLIGNEKAREINRRKIQFGLYNPGLEPIKFKQWRIPRRLEERMRDGIPTWLSSLAPGEPTPILQSGDGGDYLPTHMGHKRITSMFMLLQGQGQETRWYRQIEPFEIIDPYRIPDHDKLEHIVTAVMEPGRWYCFNHKAWHSVHQFAARGMRVNMGFDFEHITMKRLVSAAKGRS